MAKINISDPEWENLVSDHRKAPHHGAEFLRWHGEFIVRFHKLLESVPEDERPEPASIAPWAAIPEDLKGANGWNQNWDDLEEKLQKDIASFLSLDDLAQEIHPLHDFLHSAVREVYRDPDIYPAENAPRSTYFWQLHGLIERWHQDWRDAQPTA